MTAVLWNRDWPKDRVRSLLRTSHRMEKKITRKRKIFSLNWKVNFLFFSRSFRNNFREPLRIRNATRNMATALTRNSRICSSVGWAFR